jgi:membrane protease YdiL (CAAX protease family)
MQHPLVRIVLALVWVGVLASLGWLIPGPLRAVAVIVAADLGYRAFVHAIEKRRTHELSLQGSAKELGAGMGIGAGLITLTAAVLWAAGCYRITGMNDGLSVVQPMAAAAQSGYLEEILLRGILFRIAEEALGSWAALVISSVVFGLAHLGNPGAGWFSAAAIAMEAGVLLAAAYMATRRLWLPIGIHFAWNFVQGGILGTAVSGHASQGLLRGDLSGPELLCGSRFGMESSVVAVVICFTAGMLLLRRASQLQHILPHAWKRERMR